jgi:hypothetical protein
MASLEDDIAMLRRLLTATLSNIRNCEAAQQGTTNSQVRSLLARRTIERQHVADQLWAELRLLHDEELAGDRVVPGFANAPSFTWSNQRTVLTKLEALESALAKSYRDALADPDLSRNFRHLLQRSYEVIKMGRDEMLNLPHLLRPAI